MRSRQTERHYRTATAGVNGRLSPSPPTNLDSADLSQVALVRYESCKKKIKMHPCSALGSSRMSFVQKHIDVVAHLNEVSDIQKKRQIKTVEGGEKEVGNTD